MGRTNSRFCLVCGGDLPCRFGHSQEAKEKYQPTEQPKPPLTFEYPVEAYATWPDREKFERVYHAFRIGADVKALEDYIANQIP